VGTWGIGVVESRLAFPLLHNAEVLVTPDHQRTWVDKDMANVTLIRQTSSYLVQ
jgi:hypothetical protein